MMNSTNQRKTAQQLNTTILKYLQERRQCGQDDLKEIEEIWEIRESKTNGFGVFVKRDVDVGEVIFKDYPVIIGPRCIPKCPKVCVNCFNPDNLTSCSKRCGLPVCSATECQSENSNHQKECKFIRQYMVQNSANIDDTLFENLTPIRSLFLNIANKNTLSCLIGHRRNIHGHEIETLKTKCNLQFKDDEEEYLKWVCCILDANAFEVTSGNYDDGNNHCRLRGLYPLGSLVNHSCIQNVVHVFNEHYEMIGKAAMFIPKNSELFHSYTRTIWGTPTRQFHLQSTKHFICKCDRCQDPTEFGTYMGSILCKICKGLMCPLNPFNTVKSKWQCCDCKLLISGQEVGHSLTVLGSILRNITPTDFPFMHRFLEGNLKSVVPETNQVAIELKFKIVLCLGRKEPYKWEELSCELLKLKQKYCEDLLRVVEQIRSGQSKIRGVLLYELLCCKRQLLKHGIKSEKCKFEEHLDEILSIMKYDVTAPKEIKAILTKNKDILKKGE